MLRETMSHAGLSLYTEVATIIVLALAGAILFYVLVWRKKAYWQKASELPLHDGEPCVAAGGAPAGEAAERRAP
ncbi:MAG: hypothetical protein IT373_33495 [Polyangiaceae bacterium]|nr:hypothetical protein [Polyangiaceae bacterium]